MRNHPPKGNWRRFETVKINGTELIQRWTNKINNKFVEIRHFCPWGMRKAMKQKLTGVNCKSTFNVLKEEVKNADIGINEETYGKSNVIIEVRNTGMGRMMGYHRIFCDHCQKNLLPSLINSISDFFADIDNPNITHILQNWDS